MDALAKLLPAEAKTHATLNGNEWVLPFYMAEQAVGIASAHLIAVLGVERFRILPHGLGVEDYGWYDFSEGGDWPTYVSQMNRAALEWIAQRERGDGFGYILTSASEDEFKAC